MYGYNAQANKNYIISQLNSIIANLDSVAVGIEREGATDGSMTLKIDQLVDIIAHNHFVIWRRTIEM